MSFQRCPKTYIEVRSYIELVTWMSTSSKRSRSVLTYHRNQRCSRSSWTKDSLKHWFLPWKAHDSHDRGSETAQKLRKILANIRKNFGSFFGTSKNCQWHPFLFVKNGSNLVFEHFASIGKILLRMACFIHSTSVECFVAFIVGGCACGWCGWV